MGVLLKTSVMKQKFQAHLDRSHFGLQHAGFTPPLDRAASRALIWSEIGPAISYLVWSETGPVISYVFWSDTGPIQPMYFGLAISKKTWPALSYVFWSDILVGKTITGNQLHWG